MVSIHLKSSYQCCVNRGVDLFMVPDLAVPKGSPTLPIDPSHLPKPPGPESQDDAKCQYNSQRLEPGRLRVLPIIEHAVPSQAFHQIDTSPDSK